MNKSLVNILGLSLLIKLLVALYIPLTLDEYYYFLWGQYPSLSYFDHPPMVGWLMILAQPLASLAEGAIRWPFLLMTHGTLFIWYLILKNELSADRLKTFLLVALLNPLWGFGVFIATPDVPLVFFWSLALYSCQQILQSDQWRHYLSLGLFLGLGFLSKYHVALFLPCLLLMLWQQQSLKKLFSTKTLAAVLVALLACSPVFIWNAQNQWASIDFQWKHGMSSRYWKWNLPFEYLLSQVFIIFPTFLLFLGNRDKKYLNHWLFYFVAFPFAFFLYSSFKARVEANWVIMSLPAVYALASLYSSENQWHWCKKTVYLWTAVFVLALGAVSFPQLLPQNNIKLFEAKKFDPVLEALDDNKHYFTFSYQLAAYLSFKKGHLYCKFKGYGRPDHFQYLPGCSDHKGGFQYITETKDNRQFERDFPNFKVLGIRPISENYKLVEIKIK